MDQLTGYETYNVLRAILVLLARQLSREVSWSTEQQYIMLNMQQQMQQQLSSYWQSESVKVLRELQLIANLSASNNARFNGMLSDTSEINILSSIYESYDDNGYGAHSDIRPFISSLDLASFLLLNLMQSYQVQDDDAIVLKMQEELVSLEAHAEIIDDVVLFVRSVLAEKSVREARVANQEWSLEPVQTRDFLNNPSSDSGSGESKEAEGQKSKNNPTVNEAEPEASQSSLFVQRKNIKNLELNTKYMRAPAKTNYQSSTLVTDDSAYDVARGSNEARMQLKAEVRAPYVPSEEPAIDYPADDAVPHQNKKKVDALPMSFLQEIAISVERMQFKNITEAGVSDLPLEESEEPAIDYPADDAVTQQGHALSASSSSVPQETLSKPTAVPAALEGDQSKKTMVTRL